MYVVVWVYCLYRTVIHYSYILIFCYSNDLCIVLSWYLLCRLESRNWLTKLMKQNWLQLSNCNSRQTNSTKMKQNSSRFSSQPKSSLPLSLQYNFMALIIYNVSTVTMCTMPTTLWEEILQCLTNPCKVSIILAICIHHMALVYTIVQCISQQITGNGKSSWKMRLQSFVELSLSLASTLHLL